MKSIRVDKNWRSILLKAWSMWFMYIALLFSLIEFLLPFGWEIGWFDWSLRTYAIVMSFVIVCGIFARLLPQSGIFYFEEET